MTLPNSIAELVKFSLRALAGILLVVGLALGVILGVPRLVPGASGAGIAAVLVVILGLGWAVRAASRTGLRLPRSDRDRETSGQ